MRIVIEHRLSQDQQVEEILLKEYELAQTAFYEIEKNVWNTANIFVVLSIGGISILVTLSQHNWANLAVVAGIGLVSISILWIWRGIIRRWWDIQNVHIYRMEEIETQVGMWKSRYIDYLDTTRILRRQPLLKHPSGDRLSKLDQEISHYSSVRVHHRIRLLIGVLMFSWIALIVRELVLTVPIATWQAIAVCFGLQ